MPAIAARIAEEVDAVITSRAIDRVHLVGHSLGGVAIRYWYDVLGGNRRADAVVTLGAPLAGRSGPGCRSCVRLHVTSLQTHR